MMQLLKSELRTEWSARSPRAAAIVAFIAGCLFPLALAPFYWWPFGLISLAGFILCLLPSNTAKAAFNRAWSFSFGQFLVGVSWVYVSMHDYGGTPMWAAAILVAIFAAALALVPATLFTVWQKYFSRAFPVLTLGAFWFLSEWFRSWFLTGFPWLFAGDGHIQTWLAGWIPLLGSYGVSLILFFSAAVLIKATQKQNLWMLIFLLAWPIGLFLKDVEWTESIGQIQVSAVQGNINQNEKWKPEMIGPTIQRYRRETEKLWDSDLILWPETAVTLLYNRFLPFLEELADEARQHDSAIITGIPYQHPESSPNAGAFHNSILAFGAAEGLYHKQRLVPFGEYIPLEQQIRGLIPFLDLPMSSFSPGASNQPLLKAEANGQLYFVAPFICYEIAYPSLVAEMSKKTEFLVTISNDAWFGDSLGPKQHMALAQMRALETGRYLLRATNTGITALVNAKGEITDRLDTQIQGSLTGTAELRQGETPYMAWGLLPHFAVISLILIASLAMRRQSGCHTTFSD